MTTLGKRIRVVRGRRSQNVFANFLGISKGALVNYEHDRSSPNAKIREYCIKNVIMAYSS